MTRSERNLRAIIIGLAAFRAFCGLLVGILPWVFGNGLDGYGATNVGCAVAIVAAATQAHRAPWLRWVQASLAFAVLFLPFAFKEDDINAGQVYYVAFVGFMLLVSSIVTPSIFNDSSRSDGSNTSNVNTPPN